MARKKFTYRLCTIRYAKLGHEFIYQFGVYNDGDLYYETNKFLNEVQPYALLSMTFEEIKK